MLVINNIRFDQTFRALTGPGATVAGGLNRPALSDAHMEARDTFRSLITGAGFMDATDTAGNLSARFASAAHDAPTVVLGSHLDSVPNGGRFDGTLGVAAAFEVMETLRDADIRLQCNLEVIDFTDEEGTWISLMGSRAAAGLLVEEHLQNPRGSRKAFDAALSNAGLTPEGILAASRAGDNLAGYLEMHIEQGTRLLDADNNIGVVTGMVGINMYLVTFTGQANHAGTTPMHTRRDATQGAAAFALAVRRVVMEQFPYCVANVGRMTFAPGAFNIVAERVTSFLECRAQDSSMLQRLESALRTEASRLAEQFRLGLDFNILEAVAPRAMDTSLRTAIGAAAESAGLRHMPLPSLAGHDAQSMAQICPAGLLFVPSVGGYSHSPKEYTSWDDCTRGAQTLLHAVKNVASGR